MTELDDGLVRKLILLAHGQVGKYLPKAGDDSYERKLLDLLNEVLNVLGG